MSDARTVQQYSDDAHDAYMVLMQAETEYVEACNDLAELSAKAQDAWALVNAAQATADRAQAVFEQAFQQVHGVPLPTPKAELAVDYWRPAQ